MDPPFATNPLLTASDFVFRLHIGVFGKQRVVDAHIAKLILDDGDLLSVCGSKNVIQESRFPFDAVSTVTGTRVLPFGLSS